MLDRMENNGFLERIFNLNDRRQIRIILTEKARTLQGKYEEVSSLMNNLFYKGFSDEEIVLFEHFLERILSNLQEDHITNE